MFKRTKLFSALLGLAVFAAPAAWADAPVNDKLPTPDGEPAEMDKPVQVFIVMGQSNTLEMGKVKGGEGSLEHAVKEEGLYPFMWDGEANTWSKRQDVRYVHAQGSGGFNEGNPGVRRNMWLTVPGNKIGIEQGIGHHLGNAIDAPVLVLKSAIGNRSLGWDILPPGSQRFEFTEKGKTYVYPGYKDEVRHGRWEKGNVPDPPKHGWYAGLQYDGDVARAKHVLENLKDHYPEATEFEVAGFLWWQGDKDRYNAGHAQRYEKNLVNLYEALKRAFNAPDAKFVTATLGQTPKEGAKNENEKLILEGMFAISDASKYPHYQGEVATVYTHPLSMGSSSNAHYGGNAKTYMNVGLGMGEAMVELLEKD